MINSRFEGVRDLAFPCEGKVPRERRMRWPHFIQNSIESTLKGTFLAEKLQIRSSDTSSVCFADSFHSKGKPSVGGFAYSLVLKLTALLVKRELSPKVVEGLLSQRYA